MFMGHAGNGKIHVWTWIDGDDVDDDRAKTHTGMMGDQAFVEGGDDILRGGDGKDFLSGDECDDTSMGGTGDDAICGGTGMDELHGQAGNDSVDGGANGDMLWGNEGDDVFVFNQINDGETDTIVDFEGGSDMVTVRGANFADVTITDSSTEDMVSTTVTIDGQDIVFAGVEASALDQDDFMLA